MSSYNNAIRHIESHCLCNVSLVTSFRSYGVRFGLLINGTHSQGGGIDRSREREREKKLVRALPAKERNTVSAVSQVNKRKTNLKTRQTLDQ